MTNQTPIRCLIMDIDGTLTDGSIIYDANGVESKHFHVADGLGIVMAQLAGLRIAAISSRTSPAVDRRLAELKVTDIVQATGNKRGPVQALMAKYGLTEAEVAFVGDDLNDMPAFDVVGTRIVVADAADPLKARADYITSRPGGRGAVREAIEYLLRRDGRYESAVATYLEHIAGSGTTVRQ